MICTGSTFYLLGNKTLTSKAPTSSSSRLNGNARRLRALGLATLPFGRSKQGAPI
jgi:hypothetical protein